jgi:hypothetical protein
MDSFTLEKINAALEEHLQLQKKKVKNLARRLVPKITEEDILNPHDFPELVKSSQFNYEDGYLAGLMAVQMTLNRIKKDVRN